MLDRINSLPFQVLIALIPFGIEKPTKKPDLFCCNNPGIAIIPRAVFTIDQVPCPMADLILDELLPSVTLHQAIGIIQIGDEVLSVIVLCYLIILEGLLK